LLVVTIEAKRSVVARAATSLIFSFTNGAEWDGPYTLKFRVPKPWQKKPLSFFNEVGVCLLLWVTMTGDDTQCKPE
jgi:hypothetical protein